MKLSDLFEIRTTGDKVAALVFTFTGAFGLIFSLLSWEVPTVDPFTYIVVALTAAPFGLTLIFELLIHALFGSLLWANEIFTLSSIFCFGLGLLPLLRYWLSSRRLPSPEECDRELDEIERLRKEREKQP